MIKWQDTYSTGIVDLDVQHKNLFIFSNDLEGILQDQDVSKQLLADTLKFLENYVNIHFGKEEVCMHRYACPIADKNKSAHQAFINAYKEFEEQLKQEGSDGYSILNELHIFLERWLVEHICKIDTKLKSCVHQ